MNITNTIEPFIKRIRTGTHQDPVRDWLVIITVSGIALAGILVWNVWAFKTLTQDRVSVPTDTQPAFSRSSLDTIHSIFDSRAAEQSKYVTGVYRFTDPSQ